MSTRLIFIRHGYSESNKDGLFTGQANINLTDLGRRQAQCAAEYLKDEKIYKFYSSTLSRAFETAQASAVLRNMDITQVSGLCEINAGDWTEQPFAEIIKNYPKEYDLWKNNMYKCSCPKGESVAEFFSRVESTVKAIAQENNGKTICIASHATPIRAICCLALGYEPKDIQNVPWSPNASINIIDYKDGIFSFVKRDIVEHLEGLMTNLPTTI